MAAHCRHIMPGGGQCHGYSLQGGNLCYFHNRQRLAAQKPASPMDSIEIPLLEDRCAIQVTITGILRAIVNKTIDRPRAALLLYGLQLSLQSVDRSSWAIPIGTVKAISETSDGDDLAANPDDEDQYEDEDGEDDSVESSDDSEQSDADSDDDSEDNSGEEDDDEDGNEGDEDGDDRVIMEGLANGDNREIMEGLLNDLEYLDSVRRQAGLDPDPSPLLPALRAHLSARRPPLSAPPSLSADPNPPAHRTADPSPASCPVPCPARTSVAPP
jgi:hypothetical protein